MSVTAVIIDDHPMCCEATRMALMSFEPDAWISCFATLGAAREAGALADLIALDLALPDNRGALTLPSIVSEFPNARIIVITAASHPEVEAQVEAAGACGFVPKSAPISTMVEAMRTVLGGGRWFSEAVASATSMSDFAALSSLTPAQTRVLEAMMDGRLNKQIAHDLQLSEITVKSHIKAILRKLNVPNRTQAILKLRSLQQ